jgi:acyl-CoA thioesterase-1
MTRFFSSLFLACVLSIFAVGLSLPCGVANAATKSAPVILVMGDSLSAGYRIATEEGWVALLQRRLKTEHLPHQVVNASISGETSSGGLNRLSPALQKYQPDIVILELGANDGLRGLPLSVMRANLQRMITASQKINARVLLLGMRLPPNYGPAYTQQFSEIYVDLAQKYRTALVPFFLDGVATRRELMQDDGLHPKAIAQPQVLDTVWPHLQPLLSP